MYQQTRKEKQIKKRAKRYYGTMFRNLLLRVVFCLLLM